MNKILFKVESFQPHFGTGAPAPVKLTADFIVAPSVMEALVIYQRNWPGRTVASIVEQGPAPHMT